MAYSGGLAWVLGHGATGWECGSDGSPRQGASVADFRAASMLGRQLSPSRLARPIGACMGFGAGCHWTGFCDKVQAFDGSSGVLAWLVLLLRMSALWFASSRGEDGARIGVRSVLVWASGWMASGWCYRSACI